MILCIAGHISSCQIDIILACGDRSQYALIRLPLDETYTKRVWVSTTTTLCSRLCKQNRGSDEAVIRFLGVMSNDFRKVAAQLELEEVVGCG